MTPTKTLSLGILLSIAACQTPRPLADDPSDLISSGPPAVLIATIGGIT